MVSGSPNAGGMFDAWSVWVSKDGVSIGIAASAADCTSPEPLRSELSNMHDYRCGPAGVEGSELEEVDDH